MHIKVSLMRWVSGLIDKGSCSGKSNWLRVEGRRCTLGTRFSCGGTAMGIMKGLAGATLLSVAGFVAAAVEALPQLPPCEASAETNRRIVLAFYNEGLVGRQPRSAFMRYMAPNFVEHKPDVPRGTREASATFLEELIKEVPQPRWEILRTIAEGNLVFLHARFAPAAGAPSYAVADVFRLHQCKIVEHWDVVAPPPRAQLNPNSRF
jgi:predicted SnoaL-like aldol condensation-catalyzing enzyme